MFHRRHRSCGSWWIATKWISEIDDGGDDDETKAASKRRVPITDRFQPALRNYTIYAHIVETEPALFPTVDQETVTAVIEATDYEAWQKGSLLDDCFVRAISTVFNGINLRSIVAPARRSIQGQIEGRGVYNKWIQWFRDDIRLGLFCNDETSLIIRVSVFADKETENGGTVDATLTRQRGNVSSRFNRFATQTNLRAIRVSLSTILFHTERIALSATPRIESLQPNDLKQLGPHSLYYRRVYLCHLLLYIIIGECKSRTLYLTMH